MAAPVQNMVAASDESSGSSSSDDEALRRCQEAVWETRAVAEKEEDTDVKQSKRVVVAAHEHDGNELQVSQGFRTHVAKKLGHLLDSYISETQTKSSPCAASAPCDDADDEGFRLFSTSIPGQTAEEPPAPTRRRPLPSSSDSDSEMEARLREAAVSLKDLVPPSTLSPPSAEPPCNTKVAEEEAGHVVKKKKKKKRRKDQEESALDADSCPVNAHGDSEHGISEQERTRVKVKRKKKKRREGKDAEEASNGISDN